jgi:hypothetical protein
MQVFPRGAGGTPASLPVASNDENQGEGEKAVPISFGVTFTIDIGGSA